MRAFGQHFLEGGQSRACLGEAVLAKRDDPFLVRDAAQLVGGSAGDDELAHALAHRQHLVDADASLVARVVALLAAGTLEEPILRIADAQAREHALVGLDLVLALRADLAQQALGDDAAQRVRQQERFDAHVGQARDGLRGADGVQRREHHVAGQRRLHAYLGCLLVADLAHQDHVRVLTQDRAQPGREGQADLRVGVDLRDARELVLDRVLERDDLRVALVEALQERVQRGRLAAAGRAGGDHEAVAALDHALERLALGRLQPEALEAAQLPSAVQDAHDDALAEERRRGGHAQVHALALEEELRAAVLRRAPLGDVEAGQHLDARQDLVRPGLRDGGAVDQRAVDAEADQELVAPRLEVDVARALDVGFLEHAAHQIDDRLVERGIDLDVGDLA